MAFCIKCGAAMDDGAAFCGTCGASQTPQAPKAEPDLADRIAGFNDTADTTAQFDKKDIEDNKVWAILAYLGILVLIPLFAAKESKFARYHTNQGFILFLLGLANTVLAIIPLLGWILAPLVAIGLLVFMILGIINACNGQAKELPLVGKIVIIK